MMTVENTATTRGEVAKKDKEKVANKRPPKPFNRLLNKKKKRE